MPSLIEDKDAIRDLLAKYCFCSDRADVEGWTALFTEDAVWDGGAAAGRWEGRKAIREFMTKAVAGNQGQPKFRHIMSNELITITGDRAAVQSYFLLLMADGPAPVPVMVGFYHDELVKSGGRWLFKSRVAHAK